MATDATWTEYRNLKGQRVLWRIVESEYPGDIEFRITLDDGQTVASDFLTLDQVAWMYKASQQAAGASIEAQHHDKVAYSEETSE